MPFNPNIHQRHSIRLSGYDYSQPGAYFVTICVKNRECLFGNIIDGEIRLNEAGKIVADERLQTANIRSEIELDEWVVMPNHFHGIVVIADTDNHTNVGAYGNTPDPQYGNTPDPQINHTGTRAYYHTPLQSPSKNLGAMVRGFKSVATRQINKLRQTPGAPLWQRNYYDHIIRNEIDLHRIREYIQTNPARWESDSLYPIP